MPTPISKSEGVKEIEDAVSAIFVQKFIKEFASFAHSVGEAAGVKLYPHGSYGVLLYAKHLGITDWLLENQGYVKDLNLMTNSPMFTLLLENKGGSFALKNVKDLDLSIYSAKGLPDFKDLKSAMKNSLIKKIAEKMDKLRNLIIDETDVDEMNEEIENVLGKDVFKGLAQLNHTTIEMDKKGNATSVIRPGLESESTYGTICTSDNSDRCFWTADSFNFLIEFEPFNACNNMGLLNAFVLARERVGVKLVLDGKEKVVPINILDISIPKQKSHYYTAKSNAPVLSGEKVDGFNMPSLEYLFDSAQIQLSNLIENRNNGIDGLDDKIERLTLRLRMLSLMFFKENLGGFEEYLQKMHSDDETPDLVKTQLEVLQSKPSDFGEILNTYLLVDHHLDGGLTNYIMKELASSRFSDEDVADCVYTYAKNSLLATEEDEVKMKAITTIIANKLIVKHSTSLRNRSTKIDPERQRIAAGGAAGNKKPKANKKTQAKTRVKKSK